MNWKILFPLVFAVSLFWGGSTAALADNYRGHGRSHYSHRVAPHYKHSGYGHDYRWQKQGGHGYHHGWTYHEQHYRFRQPFVRHHYYPYSWHGGPFIGGTFFLPGWGVVFGGHGRW